MNKFSILTLILSALLAVQSKSVVRIVKRNELSYELSHQNDRTSELIASSTELALEHCKKSFKWERWNCPSNSFLSKRNSNLIDREQAFVKAMITASLIYTVMKNCSQETHSQQNCGCKILKETLGNDLAFSLSGCKNSNTKITSKDAQSFANAHNSLAGEVVKTCHSFLISNTKTFQFSGYYKLIEKIVPWCQWKLCTSDLLEVVEWIFRDNKRYKTNV